LRLILPLFSRPLMVCPAVTASVSSPLSVLPPLVSSTQRCCPSVSRPWALPPFYPVAAFLSLTPRLGLLRLGPLSPHPQRVLRRFRPPASPCPSPLAPLGAPPFLLPSPLHWAPYPSVSPPLFLRTAPLFPGPSAASPPLVALSRFRPSAPRRLSGGSPPSALLAHLLFVALRPFRLTRLSVRRQATAFPALAGARVAVGGARAGPLSRAPPPVQPTSAPRRRSRLVRSRPALRGRRRLAVRCSPRPIPRLLPAALLVFLALRAQSFPPSVLASPGSSARLRPAATRVPAFPRRLLPRLVVPAARAPLWCRAVSSRPSLRCAARRMFPRAGLAVFAALSTLAPCFRAAGLPCRLFPGLPFFTRSLRCALSPAAVVFPALARFWAVVFCRRFAAGRSVPRRLTFAPSLPPRLLPSGLPPRLAPAPSSAVANAFPGLPVSACSPRSLPAGGPSAPSLRPPRSPAPAHSLPPACRARGPTGFAGLGSSTPLTAGALRPHLITPATRPRPCLALWLWVLHAGVVLVRGPGRTRLPAPLAG